MLKEALAQSAQTCRLFRPRVRIADDSIEAEHERGEVVDDGEALRKRFDLEEEVLVAEEHDRSLGAHYGEADAPLCEVSDLLFCRDERVLLHDRATKTKMRL